MASVAGAVAVVEPPIADSAGTAGGPSVRTLEATAWAPATPPGQNGSMPRRRFVLDAPDRFVADAVGRPGQRTFYLQVRQGRATISVALEKVQLQLLTERLALLLDEVERRGLERAAESSADVSIADDTAPLDQPLVPIFRVGAMVLAWRGEEQRIVVETRAETDDAEEDDLVARGAAGAGDDLDDGPDLVRVSMTGDMARAFVRRAVRVVAAGRPPCPICGEPLDSDGHVCPRRGAYLN